MAGKGNEKAKSRQNGRGKPGAKIKAVEKETKAILKEAYSSIGFSRRGIKRRLNFNKQPKPKEEESPGTPLIPDANLDRAAVPPDDPIASTLEDDATTAAPTEDIDFDINIANAEEDFQAEVLAPLEQQKKPSSAQDDVSLSQACQSRDAPQPPPTNGESVSDPTVASNAQFANLIEKETEGALAGDALVLNDDFWQQEQAEPKSYKKGDCRKKKKGRKKKKADKRPSNKSEVAPTEDTTEDDQVQAESNERHLDFESEVEAVNSGVRAFVPNLSVTPSQLREQQALLQSVEATSVTKEQLDDAYRQKRLQRPIREKLEDASMKIQRVYRGHCGRQMAAHRRANLVKERERMKQYELEVDQAWTEVHDPATGDTWFYNEKTGQSQWETPPVFAERAPANMPDDDMAIQGSIASAEELTNSPALDEAPDKSRTESSRTVEGFDGRDRLPPLATIGKGRSIAGMEVDEFDEDGIPYNKSSLYPHSEASVSTPAESLVSDAESPGPASSRSRLSDSSVDSSESRTEDPATQMPQDEDEAEPRRTFFLPDGSTDVNLRDTIRMALAENKFDSVSSLIASKAKAKTKAKNSASKPQKEWSIRPRLVAPLKLPRGFRRPRKPEVITLPKVPESTSRGKGKAKVKSTAPTIYQVTHPGLKAGDMKLDVAPAAHSTEKGEAGDVTAPAGVNKEICFLCWSYGGDAVQHCDIHPSVGNNKSEKVSVLTCANWTLTALERKYRSEDVEEIFSRSNASVRWDATRRRFVTVIEAKHAVYRNWHEMASAFNLTSRSKVRLQFWLRSILCALKLGKVKTEKGKRRASFLQAKDALVNAQIIRSFKATVHLLEPRPPVTLSESAMKSKKYAHTILADEGYIVLSAPPERSIIKVIAPTPKPYALLQPYQLDDYLPPRYVRIPAPSVMFSRDSDGSDKGSAPNRYMDAMMAGSWLERLSAHLSMSVTSKALKEVRDQVPEVAKLRSKHARATTNKFATFFRSAMGSNGHGRRDKGMPPARAILSQFVTTAVAAQCGKFIVTTRATLAPSRFKYIVEDIADPDNYTDRKAVFRAAEPVDHAHIGKAFKSLSSALDKRIPPSIAASAAALEQQASANYHGVNRYKQTGETQFTGFRTTELVGMGVLKQGFEGSEFVPSAEIAVPNSAGILGSMTTEAGIDYPFCVPSTRETSMLDNYNLLTSTDTTANSACCFTALGRQDPGCFSMERHRSRDLGVLELRLYRSFAYFQLPHIEEYKTVDGLPYWYNKKTGETFWEHPLEEAKSADHHRPMLPESPRTHTKASEKRHSSTVGAKRKPASQALMRKHMLLDPEELEDANQADENAERPAEDELDTAQRAAKEKLYRDRIGHAGVIKGNEPIGDLPPARPPLNIEDGLPSSRAQTPATTFRPITPSLKSPRSQATSKSTRASTPSVQFKADSSSGEKREGQPVIHERLLHSLSTALETAMASSGTAKIISSDDSKQAMLQLGLGLGLGIGLRQQQGALHSESFPTALEDRQASRCGSESEARPESSGVESVDTSTSFGERTDKVLLVTTPRQSESKPEIVVGEATPTPDEACSDSAVRHEAAGEGKLWQAVGSTTAKMQGALFKSAQPLPEGFVGSIQMSHTAKQYTDYLPTQPNINEPTSVGIVKPVRILNEWTTAGFDPWSNGKDPVSTSFVPTLYADENDDGAGAAGGDGGDRVAPGGVMDSVERQKLEQAERLKQQEDLERVFSYCRHGKYEEIDAFFDEPDTTLPIDAKDSLGNTLLSIAAQNGNKRIAKLCLRRGADVNTQNLTGQSVLHYCIAYGFEDLADYFIQKGADDTMTNADGLTCYEGLNLDDVNNI